MTNRDCEHGSLARSCPICELQEEIVGLKNQNVLLKAELEKFKKCSGWEVFTAADGHLSIRRKDCDAMDHYHREEECRQS